MGQRNGLSSGDIATINSLYKITKNVTFGSFSGKGATLGSFSQSGTTSDWVEKKSNGQISFRFKETSRTDQLIRLRDDSRKVNINLDLERMVVHYSDDSGRAFDLYKIISSW